MIIDSGVTAIGVLETASPLITTTGQTYFLRFPGVPQDGSSYRRYAGWLQFIVGFPTIDDASQIDYGQIWFPSSEVSVRTDYQSLVQRLAFFWYVDGLDWELHQV